MSRTSCPHGYLSLLVHTAVEHEESYPEVLSGVASVLLCERSAQGITLKTIMKSIEPSNASPVWDVRIVLFR